MTVPLSPAKSGRTIALRHPLNVQTILEADVYFPFPSGRLGYDCVTCQAKCCRGFGYMTTVGAELDRQFEMRPTLPLFVSPPDPRTSGGQVSIGNCAPGCFFLADDGRCDIHRERGFAAKPETCRLFPFNNFRRVGRFLIVAPHSFLCPLNVLGPEREDTTSGHDTLLEGMAVDGIAARIPDCEVGVEPVDRVIVRERAIVALAEQYLRGQGYFAFLRAQQQMDDPPRPEGNRTSASLSEMSAWICELLGIPRDAVGSDPRLVQTMISLTPILRSRFVFWTTDASAGSAKRRAMPVPQERLPFAMLATYLIVEAARSAGMATITYQTVSKLAGDFGEVVPLLAHLDSVLVWGRGERIEIPHCEGSEARMRVVRVARALLVQQQRKRMAPMIDILREHLPNEPLPRALFVKDVARAVTGKLTPLAVEQRGRRQAPVREQLRDAAHRWMLGNLDDAVLDALYQRIYRASPTGGSGNRV